MISGWSRVAIAGKPAELFDPPNSLPFALLFLHDQSGKTPAIDSTFTAELIKHRLRCVAPQAPESWWVDRICSEFDAYVSSERHIRENVASWIETNWKLGRKAIGLAGIEMGGQGAIRLGFKYPEQFLVVGSIGGAFDFHEVYGQGHPLDEMYTSLFRELLTYMIEDARNITACTHLLFMAKNLERIGNHTTNIAETLYFLVHGKPLAQIRPKRDRTIMAEAPGEGTA